jgi:2-polyprenyl-3-methyl-5-hydroxy-6-metoxy-1,4-benzoquinol methylase
MSFEYVGSELEVFSIARNWRAYWTTKIRPHLGNKVLEIGAGIGSATKQLSNKSNLWVAVEPDRTMAETLQLEILPANTSVICGTIDSVAGNREYFESILYLDVLEHIENDILEVQKASDLLIVGGKLIILSPAHNSLMSAFDRQIGHYRRYSKASLDQIRPEGMILESAIYLDSLGLVASIANRFLLQQDQPKKSQIKFWDSVLIPISRIVDRVLLNKVGKTVVVVWKKT